MGDESFSGRLKRLREAAGLSQSQLAQRAGMHRLGVAKRERGLRGPTWATVQALARALGLNCLAFTDEGERPAPAPPEGERPPVKPRAGRPPKKADQATGPAG